MIIYSTLEGTVSRRYEHEGSPLLQCFANRIIELAENGKLKETDFRRVASLTQNTVCDTYRGIQPSIEDALSKDFYLPLKGNIGISFIVINHIKT